MKNSDIERLFTDGLDNQQLINYFHQLLNKKQFENFKQHLKENNFVILGYKKNENWEHYKIWITTGNIKVALKIDSYVISFEDFDWNKIENYYLYQLETVKEEQCTSIVKEVLNRLKKLEF
jgi:hypothetical protein